MTSTAFRDHKIESFYARLDSRGDGKLQWDDIQRLADSLITEFDAPVESPKAQDVVASFRTFWGRMVEEMDTGGNGELSREEYRAGMTTLFVKGPHFEPVFRPAIEAVANLCDTDDDGALNRAEYVAMESAFGVDAAEAEHAFGRLDLNGDGEIDIDELVDAARIYYTSDDPDAVRNWLVGRQER